MRRSRFILDVDSPEALRACYLALHAVLRRGDWHRHHVWVTEDFKEHRPGDTTDWRYMVLVNPRKDGLTLRMVWAPDDLEAA